MGMTQSESVKPSLLFNFNSFQMTNSEMKAALAAKEIAVPSRANAEELKRLCEANGIDLTANNVANNQNSAPAPAPAASAETSTAPIKVMICGVSVDLEPASAEVLDAFVTAKRQREFPDFVGKLPDGRGELTGQCSIYTWHDYTEDKDVKLLLAIVKASDGKLYGVGAWDLCWSVKKLVIDEKVREQKYVFKQKTNRASDRDTLVINAQAGTPFVVHSGVGRFDTNKKNRFMKWIESE